MAQTPNTPFKKNPPQQSFVAHTPPKSRLGSLEHDMGDTNKSSNRKEKNIEKENCGIYRIFPPEASNESW